jgi:hypothetical protein
MRQLETGDFQLLLPCEPASVPVSPRAGECVVPRGATLS